MTKNEASKMLKALLACQQCLDKALKVSNEISVQSEKEDIQKSLTSVISDINIETIRKIAIQHPELNPYKNKLKVVD